MIYLDHAAATRVEDAAIEEMARFARATPGNPQSVHTAGRDARAAVERARTRVAEFLGWDPFELRFAPSGTIALQRAIRDVLAHAPGAVVSNALEHTAVRDLHDAIATTHELRLLAMPGGEIDMAAAEPMLADASVVILSALNHELGTAPPLAQLFELAPHAWWIIDTVQAAVWLDLGELVRANTILVASSAKLGGPAGVAALRVPRPQPGASAIVGAFHGPEPWFAAVGFGAACAARRDRRAAAFAHASANIERLLAGLRAHRSDLVVNAGPSRLGPILDVSVPGLDARHLEAALDLHGVAVARTSACRQRLDDGSAVVAAAFPDEPWRATTATRWSAGWTTSDADIDGAIVAFARCTDTR